MKITIKDLVNIPNPRFLPIAHVENKIPIYIYRVFKEDNDTKAICSKGIEGTKEIYRVIEESGLNYLSINSEYFTYNYALNDLKIDLEMVGEIKDNKIYHDSTMQGYVYKNELNLLKTIDLSDKEIDKLSFYDKVCYIPESCFNGKSNIIISSRFINGEDYCTVKTIREDIKAYFGDEIYSRLSKNDIREMVQDVFETVDWQHPYSLIEGDSYLDGYVEDKLGINFDEKRGEDYGLQ